MKHSVNTLTLAVGRTQRSFGRKA